MKKIRSIIIFLGLIAIVILASILVWLNWSEVVNFLASPQNQVVPIKQKTNQDAVLREMKNTTMPKIEGFRQYGEWPLSQVPLSEGRGNPFLEKTATTR
ncbi:MAG: hypothetical protein WCP18_00220 [bacterium]